MGPQPNATHPNEREPGAREREKERLFLATMPSSSLPGSQRPREQRPTCPPLSSAQGGSRNVCFSCWQSWAFGHPPPTLLAQNSVIMSLFAELGVGWPGPFQGLSPSLGTRDYLQSLSEATEPRRISSFPDVRTSGLTSSTYKGGSESPRDRLKG